jgi:hypothetical protein
MMECVVMPFDLFIALAMFQRVMNDSMRDFLYKFVIPYLDAVCAYS